tara:strand:+ start:4865 stop:5452 length:588 start_codon:yes stop_codon:yes gene_type:complete
MATDKKERKLIILQSLAGMLEERDAVKITTAELAKRSEISEAAIYKHFPSKRKIFEELVIFFEDNIFPRISMMKKELNPQDLSGNIIALVLNFCDKNKGFSKILTREAFTADESKINEKVSIVFDKLNLEIKQSLQEFEKVNKKKINLNITVASDLLLACLEGQIQSFVRSKFKKDINQSWKEQWDFLAKVIYPS